MIASDRASIFGDTYDGVPNPQIPIQHPWPTRYHGPIFTTPRFGMPFAARPYARAPYSGLGASEPFIVEHPFLAAAAAGAVAGAASALIYRSFQRSASEEKVGSVAGAAGSAAPSLFLLAIMAVLTGMSGTPEGTR